MNKTRLDTYLFEKGFYESRARATSAIKAGKVIVDGNNVIRPSYKVSENSRIIAESEHPWVSRGGLKLAHALDVFKIDVSNLICLDVGSSTGGFTDVLLSGNAAKVYAVDVGRDQLHSRLRSNPRVIVMESKDARNLHVDDFETLPEIIVCDASFISAAKVLECPLNLVHSGTSLITLFKPQFEVGPENIGRGGLVKEGEIALLHLSKFQDWILSQGWDVIRTDISPVKGRGGNTEFLLYARKNKPGEPGL